MQKPVGILLILDEECAFPRASDQTMLDKLNSNHAGKTPHGSFVKPKLAKGAFGVVHYAGTVTYDITNFLDKNRDRLRDDLEGLMFSSTANPLLKEVFHTQKLASTVDSPSTPTLLSPTHSPANSIGRSITPPPQTGAATPHKTSLTVGARFHVCRQLVYFFLKNKNKIRTRSRHSLAPLRRAIRSLCAASSPTRSRQQTRFNQS